MWGHFINSDKFCPSGCCTFFTEDRDSSCWSISSVPCKQWVLENSLFTSITSVPCRPWVMEKVPLQHFVYWYHITTVQTMRHGESAPPTLCSLVSHHYYACWVMVKVPLPHFVFWYGWLCETHFLLLCGFLNGEWLKLVSIFLSCCFMSFQFYF